MSEIETWIEDAARHLHIELRKLSANEAESVQKKAMSRYVKITNPRVWWLNLAKPVDEYYDRSTVKLSDILPENCESCWLIPETDADLLPVYEIYASAIERLIEDCPGFEYNIVAKDFSWLVIETDHDQYYVCRNHDKLPELMADST
jgi:hypothetical protein